MRRSRTKATSASRAGGRPGGFDPEDHRDDLVAVIREIEAQPELDAVGLDAILRRHPRDGRGFFSRAQLIAGFRRFEGEAAFRMGERSFVDLVRMRPVRTRSGVTPLTVLTRPFPCPGECVFCPNDVRMPKSYLADEPGAQRAAVNRFDPYLQTWNRLDAYRAIGHPTDKVELIVLGGTWSFYPESYQVWFAKRCFEALNDFGEALDDFEDGRDGRSGPGGRQDAREAALEFERLPPRIDGRDHTKGRYNRLVSAFLSQSLGGELQSPCERADWSELEREQRRNEDAACRSVGFAIETRPDHVTEREVVRIRRLGCTKVQIGFQSLSDAVLLANKRGHDVATTRRAVRLLRGAGFKLHAHWMANLLGSTPERDLKDFARLFDDRGFRPDELKLYPCSLIESAELMRSYERGEWRPYTHDELLAVVTGALERVPRYCRVTRVIRDISSDDIVAGNKLTNFREIAERTLAAQGRAVRDIRSRELRGQSFDPASLELRASEYASSVGREVFLEFVTPGDRIVGFLRLTLPDAPGYIDEIASSALVREVHVYGTSLGIGQAPLVEPQHRGLGRRLLDEARRRAAAAGFSDLAVISAIGTRPYYRKLGFVDGPLYQHFALPTGSKGGPADA